MGIVYHSEERAFHLFSDKISYIMQVAKGGRLAHVYWGKRIGLPNLDRALWQMNVSFAANAELEDRSYSMQGVCQEYATGCSTDYREPSVCLLFEDGSRVVDLVYESHEIVDGKPALEGLPATYMEDASEGQTLIITMRDMVKNVRVLLSYTVFDHLDAIARSVRICNDSAERVVIEKVYSANVDFEEGDFDFISLHGGWAKERHMERTPLRHGYQTIDSKRGASSHQHNPFFALTDKNADESTGSVYGFNLVYSGNFAAGAEKDELDGTRAFIGLNGYDFSWQLEAGASFQAPEAVLVYSAEGLGGMSRIYHKLYRTRLVRGKYRDAVRPILANNWEATYFDFDEEKILSLAKEAASLGIELLVLDDGWFGKRNDDRSSLGDWFVNKEKLPHGIKGLAEQVEDCGIKFGLWFEPEMVSPDSELYRAHPDWCIHVPGRVRTECRQQLTLDLSREDVCNYLIETIGGVLDDAPISYVKWDMNRHMTNLGSAGLDSVHQKEMAHRYMLGLYRVMDAIVSAHPDVLFESCSGGGGRFDAGILYYMPQTWTSDDTDAVERLYIQYGTSLVYPISAMGSHVSAVPNHQVGRMTSLKMRGDVAMSGNFGYELDLNRFTEEEKKEVRAQVAQYKELRTFVQSADMYRLESPFEGNTTAWMFLSEDKKDIFAAYFRINAIANPGRKRMRFTALAPDGVYEELASGARYRGDELMEIGIPVMLHGDFKSVTWRLRLVEE